MRDVVGAVGDLCSSVLDGLCADVVVGRLLESGEAVVAALAAGALSVEEEPGREVVEEELVLEGELLVLASRRLDSLTEAVLVQIGAVFAEDALGVRGGGVVDREAIVVVVGHAGIVLHASGCAIAVGVPVFALCAVVEPNRELAVRDGCAGVDHQRDRDLQRILKISRIAG